MPKAEQNIFIVYAIFLLILIVFSLKAVQSARFKKIGNKAYNKVVVILEWMANEEKESDKMILEK